MVGTAVAMAATMALARQRPVRVVSQSCRSAAGRRGAREVGALAPLSGAKAPTSAPAARGGRHGGPFTRRPDGYDSSVVPRFVASLAVLALALALGGCGGADKTPTTISAGTPLPLTVQRSGGVAGIHETLRVRRDGSATVRARGGATRRLTPQDTDAIRRTLREFPFAGLHERYAPPAGVQVSDGIDYTFTAGGRTIVVQEMAEGVPSALVRLKTEAAEAMNP
jgi:hypothetical protein